MSAILPATPDPDDLEKAPVLSDSSFRRKPESRKFRKLDPGLRRGDESVSGSLSRA